MTDAIAVVFEEDFCWEEVWGISERVGGQRTASLVLPWTRKQHSRWTAVVGLRTANRSASFYNVAANIHFTCCRLIPGVCLSVLCKTDWSFFLEEV